MHKTGRDTIQAVPLYEGKINVGAGSYVGRGVIHCETDAIISFPDFKVDTPYSMFAGEDRTFVGNFNVVSGTVTYE